MSAPALSFWRLIILVGVCMASPLRGATLPIYIEDNHLGAFHFFATHLPLDEPHALLLIDAHSDATAIHDSDRLRTDLRRVASEAERERRIIEWREFGVLQPFNWIEPLIPRPFERVVWIARTRLANDEGVRLTEEAHTQLDWRLDLGITTREAGLFAPRFELTDLNAWKCKLDDSLPVVASIDLDFFSGKPAAQQEAEFDQLWSAILDLPELHAISIALSRPWLVDDEEANRLLAMAFEAALRVANGVVFFEPFPPAGPDHSELAKQRQQEGKAVSDFEPERASDHLKQLWSNHQDHIAVRLNRERWDRLLDDIAISGSTGVLVVDDHQPSTDEIWRIRKGAKPAVRILGHPRGKVKVRWFVQEPERWVWNVLPEFQAGKAFTGEASAHVRWRDRELASTKELALPFDTWSRALHPEQGLGRVRLRAEIEAGEDSCRTAILELRVFEKDGFRAGLSEQMQSAYVFGAGFLRRGPLTGPDTLAGSDCANFLVSAWRRAGVPMPWCNPAQLRDHLVPAAAEANLQDPVAIEPEWLDEGLVVDFGSHVGAVYEDLPPLGILDGNDFLIHHLSGPPEIIALGDLLKRRQESKFAVWRRNSLPSRAKLAFGGDVLVTRDHPLERLSAGQPLGDALLSADFSVANLEGVPSLEGTPENKTFTFRIPIPVLAQLQAAGLDAVNLANNHAGDFGSAAFRDALHQLDHAGLLYFGGGHDLEAAMKPLDVSVNGLRVALFGVTCIDPDRLPAGPEESGVVSLPNNEEAFARALRQARHDYQCILVMAHWGDENTGIVSQEQRKWARWLIDHGASAVIGCHSHCPQRVDTYKGRPIFYSLGNLVVNLGDADEHPRRLSRAFQTASVARLKFDNKGQIRSFRQSTFPPEDQKDSIVPPAH